ncbi:unnamed protein product [Parnassius apollo]|uniref:(apollo) hypothetical protein n=1 Tax=Parnassius apollo TaxID=110799 RepID=A0A8S3X3R4_PARAO|nr:unnamed protein product [Parnassius apollo]
MTTIVERETLKLRVKQMEKSTFLTRLFRKYTRRLHIYIDCSEPELENFTNYILPQFFDTQKLIEVIFIGPSYIRQNPHTPVVKLKRKITESLLFKHIHCIQRLAFMGCEMSAAQNVENEKYTHKHFENYSRPLSFSNVSHPADAVLSRCNALLMMFSTLQHISVDYDHISTEALETLSHLTLFKNLTLNIARRRKLVLKPINWHLLDVFYPNGLDVSVNIIGLPPQKLKDVMDKVLVEGLTLVSLKVMFCETFYAPLLRHLLNLYTTTLRELVWVDCPDDSPDTLNRNIKTSQEEEYDVCNVNPFILLCWHCVQLQTLVIHGYWVWQYDLEGFVRLRKSLRRLEVSALSRGWRLALQRRTCARRLRLTDVPTAPSASFVQQVNEHTDFKWKPCQWSKLHPGLRARATPEQRADYVLHEARQTLGIT